MRNVLKIAIFAVLVIGTVMISGCTNTGSTTPVSQVTSMPTTAIATTVKTTVSAPVTIQTSVQTPTPAPTEIPKDITIVNIDSNGDSGYTVSQESGYRISYPSIYTRTNANRLDGAGGLSRIVILQSESNVPINISKNGIRYISDSFIDNTVKEIKGAAAEKISKGEGPATIAGTGNYYTVNYYLSDAKADPTYYIINGNPARHIETAMKQPGNLQTAKADLYIISNGNVAYYLFYVPYGTAGVTDREIGQKIIQTFTITS